MARGKKPSSEAVKIIAERFDKADKKKTGKINGDMVAPLIDKLCKDFGTELEGVDINAMYGPEDSITFINLLALLDSEAFRPMLPDAARAEVHRRAMVLDLSISQSPSPGGRKSATKRSPTKRSTKLSARPVVHVLPNDGGIHVGAHQVLFYSLQHLCEAATQKLSLARCGRRVFTSEGVEIKDGKDVTTGSVLIVSGGEPFRPRAANRDSHRSAWNNLTSVPLYEAEEEAGLTNDDKVVTPGEYVTELVGDMQKVLNQLGQLHKHDYEHCNNLLKAKVGVETVNRTRAVTVYRVLCEEKKLEFNENIDNILSAVAEKQYIFVHCLPNDGAVDYDYITTAAPNPEVLMRDATKKLKLSWAAKRMFDLEGTEITADNFSEMVTNAMSVVFSTGEDFLPRSTQVRHARFGKMRFDVDLLEMTAEQRNSDNPIVAEGYAHTRTPPFLRTQTEEASKLSVFDPDYRPPSKFSAKFSSPAKPYSPPVATKFNAPPDVDEPGAGLRSDEPPSSRVKAKLSVHRYEELDVNGAQGQSWQEETAAMSNILDHYHETLYKQRARTQLDQYIPPALLRGKNLKLKKPTTALSSASTAT